MSEIWLTEFRAIKKTEKGTVYIAIEHPPTIDAVEVVRCRDCCFAQPISERASRAFDAERVRDCTVQRGDWKMVYGFSVVAADGYCDDGKRKEAADGRSD